MALHGGQDVAEGREVNVFELMLHRLLLRCSAAGWPRLWGRAWAAVARPQLVPSPPVWSLGAGWHVRGRSVSTGLSLSAVTSHSAVTRSL